MMRIAQVATLATPVQEHGAGSIEGVIWLLARELTALGHDVTTFAVAGSSAAGAVIETLPGPYGFGGSPGDWHLCEWINLCRAVAVSDRFDVIHSHAYLWGIPVASLSSAPMVHTLHIRASSDEAWLRTNAPDACITAISHAQWSDFPALAPAAVIPHGVDPATFTFRGQAEDYVCFLGRFTPGKGPLGAIATARALGIRLVLAGPPNPYYHERVSPLVDGRTVEYVGPVGGRDRDALLGGARALLYPITEPEPFGLVMIEAMMCGTPVVATRIGAVPEIVDKGITGYTARDAEELPNLVHAAVALDRECVRRRAETRFSADRMARDYVRVYERVRKAG
jgi:glycosyltransferase involved in cell wall biosynthesis